VSEETFESRRRLRILLAEDNAVNQMLATIILQKQGHEVVPVKTGVEALAALDRPFDVVLMDVHMPEMDGIEATSRIRAREGAGGQRLPIIAMTAPSSAADRQRCLQVGMDGYVGKPIQAEELLRTIDNVLHSRGGAAHESDAATAQPVVDMAAILKLVGGKQERLQTLVDVFFGESNALLSDIRAALTAGDASTLRRAAHSLKGAVAIFGAAPATAAAQRLESLGEASNLVDAFSAIDALEQELERLKPALVDLGRPKNLA
jgi:CheY-like chemotaxis protein